MPGKSDKDSNIKHKGRVEKQDKGSAKYNKKKWRDNDSDDSSIDSHGNIRGLIDYDFDSSEDDRSYYESSTEQNSIISRRKLKPRAAAIKAKIKISKIINKSHDISYDHSPADKPSNKNKNKHTTKIDTKNRVSVPQKSTREVNKKVSSKMNKTTNERDDVTSTSSESDFDFDEDDSSYESTYDEEMNDDDDEMDDEEEDEEDEEEMDDEDEEGDDDEEGEDNEDDEDNEDEDGMDGMDGSRNNAEKFGGIVLSLGGGDPVNTMIPRRYNMKKEPQIVKKFVKLLSAPIEDNSIDTQIDQFKALTAEKQNELITALENRPTISDKGVNLMLRILQMKLPAEIQSTILSKYNNLQSLDTSSNEYFKLRNWLDKVVSVPFGIYKEIPVRLEDGNEACGAFMTNAKKCLDASVFGQEESKMQIMQFISTKIANPNGIGLSLLLIGPPGVGKTSLIKNGIAKALGWPFQFISLGGDSDASTYTGHQLVYESSHCGKIVNSLVASKSMSTVLMFDEVDKISQTPKGEEIQNMLIHLTDPVQNSEFEDKYLAGIPIDLSRVMFVFSANDINKIDRVLLDRMIVINLNGYDLKQKITIAENYLLPGILKEVNLSERVAMSRDIIEHIIESYAKEEKGVRELKRCLEQVIQKINMLRMFNSPDLPFYIKDFSLPFVIKKEHISLFLKKKENKDLPPDGMYV